MLEQFKPFQYFQAYLKYGGYPFFEGDGIDYYQKLLNTINLVLEIDVMAIQPITYENVTKIKRLLYVLATNVPYTPNISKLSEQIGLNRNALVQAIQLLSRAELLHSLYKQTKRISSLNKPDKIWLHNTNLNYAIGNQKPDSGNSRETFFINQLSLNHRVALPLKGDFLIDEHYLFEVGGRNKTMQQVKEQANAFLVKDAIETGFSKTIPIWLFGFLY